MGASHLWVDNSTHRTSTEWAENIYGSAITAALTGNGVTANCGVLGLFNVAIWGTFSATVTLNRSFDGGTTWIPVTFSDGTAVSWTAPMSTTLNEPEPGMLYQLSVSNFVSGTINWRISQ